MILMEREKPIADAGAADASGMVPADYKTSFKKINHARFVSVGHAAGRWDVDVYANEAGARALELRSRDVPVGAVVVQEHFERSEEVLRVGGWCIKPPTRNAFASLMHFDLPTLGEVN